VADGRKKIDHQRFVFAGGFFLHPFPEAADDLKKAAVVPEKKPVARLFAARWPAPMFFQPANDTIPWTLFRYAGPAVPTLFP